MLRSFLKVVSHIHVCSTYTAMAGFHTEFKGDTIMLGGGLGTCSVKIMILEVRFLLINFEKLIIFFFWGGGGISQGSPTPPCMNP